MFKTKESDFSTTVKTSSSSSSSLSSKDIENVQISWKAAAPHAAAAADIFYDQLFQDESVKSLFPNDMSKQKTKLMEVLAIAVSSLENLEKLTPTLEKLGKLHLDKNVKEEHYDLVGQCLINTLKIALSESIMTEEVSTSWGKVYNILASVMKGNLYE